MAPRKPSPMPPPSCDDNDDDDMRSAVLRIYVAPNIPATAAAHAVFKYGIGDPVATLTATKRTLRTVMARLVARLRDEVEPDALVLERLHKTAAGTTLLRQKDVVPGTVCVMYWCHQGRESRVLDEEEVWEVIGEEEIEVAVNRYKALRNS